MPGSSDQRPGGAKEMVGPTRSLTMLKTAAICGDPFVTEKQNDVDNM